MRTSTMLRYGRGAFMTLLFGALAFQLLANASASATITGGLYVGQLRTDAVNGYLLPDQRNSPPRCTVGPAGINGIGVNSNGVLYVPRTDNSVHEVLTFGPRCGPAGAVLTVPNADPSDVAFDGATVYVCLSDTGGIDVYANGATSPTGMLTNSIGCSFGIATDDDHNVFDSNSGGHIVEFPGGKMPGTVLNLTGLTSPLGLTFDRRNDLLVIDDGSDQALIYTPPYSGAPAKTIALQCCFPLYGKLDSASRTLYVSNQETGDVDVYAYPSGTYEYSITNGLGQGQLGAAGIAVIQL